MEEAMLSKTEIEEGLKSYEEKYGEETTKEKRDLIFKSLTENANLSEIGNKKINIITEIIYILGFNKKLSLDMNNFKKR